MVQNISIYVKLKIKILAGYENNPARILL